jgi:hypothetical protein
LGVEYKQYYIQKCLDIMKKNHPLFHLAHPKYPYYIVLKYPSKNGVF